VYQQAFLNKLKKMTVGFWFKKIPLFATNSYHFRVNFLGAEKNENPVTKSYLFKGPYQVRLP
jgi:hypothetical protein